VNTGGIGEVKYWEVIANKIAAFGWMCGSCRTAT